MTNNKCWVYYYENFLHKTWSSAKIKQGLYEAQHIILN